MAGFGNDWGAKPGKPKKTSVTRGKSTKGAKGEWHVRPDGKKVFVAKEAKTPARPSGSGGSGGSSKGKLTVKRFQTWSPEHQRQSLKFHGGDGMTAADFYALPSAKQRDIMARVLSGTRTATAPDSALRPQTMQDIYKAAEQAAGLKYGSTERQIQVDQKASDIQQGRIGDWFGQYQKTLADAAERTKANFAATQGQVAATTAASEGQAAVTQQGVQSQQDADAALRGAKVDPAIAAAAAQAAASRKDSGNTMGALIGAQGATHYAAGQNMRGVAANQKVQAHLAETATKKSLGGKLRDLLTEKGQFEQVEREGLRDTEHKHALERKAYNLDVVEAATKTNAEGQKLNKYGYTNKEWSALSESKRNSVRSRGTGAGPNPDTLNKYGFTNNEWKALSAKEKQKYRDGTAKPKKDKKPTTGPGSLTPAEEQKYIGRINTAVGRFGSLPFTDPDTGKVYRTEGAMAQAMKAGGVDPRVVDVAISIFRNKGRIGPDGRAKAHDIGIHIGGRWKNAPKGGTPRPRNPSFGATPIPGLGGLNR